MHIEFTTDLGAKVTVSIKGPEELLAALRKYGRHGWYSGEVPAGGYQFPLENEHDFSWALIGARKFTTSEGEEAVYCRGHVYKRRELEAVNSKKLTLPAAVKYSRGAKPTDPPHLRERTDGEIEYVSLAIFRGGKRQDRYAEPQGQGGRPALRQEDGPPPPMRPAPRPVQRPAGD